jgi:hypothetical protein
MSETQQPLVDLLAQADAFMSGEERRAGPVLVQELAAAVRRMAQNQGDIYEAGYIAGQKEVAGRLRRIANEIDSVSAYTTGDGS